MNEVRHQLIYEEKSASPGPFLRRLEDAVSLAKPYFQGADREKLYVCTLNAKCEPLTMELAAIGARGSMEVDMAALFKTALVVGATGIIVFHNHLSSDPSPSQEDIFITKRMQLCGAYLNVIVLDHIILNCYGQHFSMREHGIVDVGLQRNGEIIEIIMQK